jgi:hypothetical protein
MTARVTQYGGEEPESGSSPRSDCDTECDNRGEKIDYNEHWGAVAGRGVVRIDHVQLQI